MKFSVNWLREFVELPPSVEELADLLTLAGIEIEGIEKRGANFDKVVVAQITASSQHPNADRLSVCQVDDGSGTDPPDRLRREELQGGRQGSARAAGRGVGERFENQAEQTARRRIARDALQPERARPFRGERWALDSFPRRENRRADRFAFSGRHDSGCRDHSEPRRSAQPFRFGARDCGAGRAIALR